ncbi:hypothetical protein [Streptomyces sp. NBC_00239]|uniref:hypothetical protein n=1 Tax=Streptomyces sp. NBC_00239 TaxID=2903640 RepID=UPI002E2A9A50|nr:hypothetical protein [Streptomyces sp. NBC_00239]
MTSHDAEFVRWLRGCLVRGGWTSLGLAVAKVKRDRDRPWQDWEEGESQLGIAETTLSRWLKSETIPSRTKLQDLVQALNLCIRDQQVAGQAREVQPVSSTELQYGIRLRNAAQTARDQTPAQRAYDQAQKELDEVSHHYQQVMARLADLLGQREGYQRTAGLLFETQKELPAAARELAEEVSEAIARIETVLDRCEMARQDAQETSSKALDLLEGAEGDRDKARRRADEQENLRRQAERYQAETATWAQFQHDMDPRWN